MLGMKLPMPHFCFKTDHSRENVSGIFIEVNEREAILTKENIFLKYIYIYMKNPWHFHCCKEKFTSQGSLP